jgi:thioredoxin
MVLQIYSATEFRRVVIDGSREQLVVVDFYADWCGPCRMVAPFIDSLATKFHQVLFVKVNVDEVQDVAQLCRVHAMPTFQLFLNGNKVDEIVGADVAALERSVAAQAQPVAFAGPGHTLGTRATSEDTKAATTTNSTPSGTPIARPNAVADGLQTTTGSAGSAGARASQGEGQLPVSASETMPTFVSEKILEELQAMGFPRTRALNACIATDNESLEKAMEWIFAHDEDPNIDKLDPALDVRVTGAEDLLSKSKEEKQLMLKRLQEEARKRREAEEKKLAIEQEKNRIRSGKEIAEAKRKAEEERRKRDIRERLREQREQQMERERLRRLLEDDRQRRLELQRGPTPVRLVEQPPDPNTNQPKAVEKSELETRPTRLQLRLPDGTNVEADFTNETRLRDVANYVLNKYPSLGERISLMRTYPRRKFLEHELDQMTLQDAELYPRGALFVLRP